MNRDEKSGKFLIDENKKNKRIGEINYNKNNSLMKIIEYNNSRDIIVYFPQYDLKIKCRYNQFKNGTLSSLYDRTIYNIGYIGEGKYSHKNHPVAYMVWNGMLRRCYDPYYLNKNPTYIDCYVCEEWLCFQNFAEWYYKNYYECNNERMNLDKDILIKGNKIYSPDTCVFVPERINKLFCKRQNGRGKYFIGVKWHKEKHVFEVGCNDINCKCQYLGNFNNELEAFTCYKLFKEKTIKQVADEYKNLIPDKLYEAMMNYQVEIND